MDGSHPRSRRVRAIEVRLYIWLAGAEFKHQLPLQQTANFVTDFSSYWVNKFDMSSKWFTQHIKGFKPYLVSESKDRIWKCDLQPITECTFGVYWQNLNLISWTDSFSPSSQISSSRRHIEWQKYLWISKCRNCLQRRFHRVCFPYQV